MKILNNIRNTNYSIIDNTWPPLNIINQKNKYLLIGLKTVLFGIPKWLLCKI